MASPKRLTEVPFVRCLSEEESAEGIPTVIRGVIDLVFVEPGGWVVVDYKTGAVSQEQVPELVEHYRGQVRSYSENWDEIVGEKVNEAGLFFTGIGEYITL